MKNGIDFIYEYSDLNLFKTRVQILTGDYADTILEFGSSILAQDEENNIFTFEYQLFQIPQHLTSVKLKGQKDFETFLAYLLVDVIDARKNDSKEKFKLMEAASAIGVKPNTIKIDPKFYFKAEII